MNNWKETLIFCKHYVILDVQQKKLINYLYLSKRKLFVIQYFLFKRNLIDLKDHLVLVWGARAK